MKEAYEPSNPLSLPFECFTYDNIRHHFPVEDHWHYFAELLLVRSGRLNVILSNDTVVNVKPGEAFLICPQVSHAFSCEAGENVSYDVIKMDINQLDDTPPYAPNVKSIITEAHTRNCCMMFSVVDVKAAGIDTMFEKCLREYKEQAYGYDLVIRALLYQITTAMIRVWMRRGFSVRCAAYQSDLFSSMDSITSYIDKHIRDGLRVEQLAQLCGMSYSGFSKKFRDLYGITCKEYIIRIRVAKAEHYLRFTNEDLTFVSQETGYADCSHMIKEFKQQKGITPAQYRKNCREG